MYVCVYIYIYIYIYATYVQNILCGILKEIEIFLKYIGYMQLKIYTVLVRVSIAVKRHHDQGNSYKRKHLIGAGLEFQRFSPLLS